MIDKWQGGFACLWEYDVSHSHLVIRVIHDGRAGNLHITCGGCTFISGPVQWENCLFKVYEMGLLNSEPSNYVLRDEKSSFEVRCVAFGTEENVEPYA